MLTTRSFARRLAISCLAAVLMAPAALAQYTGDQYAKPTPGIPFFNFYTPREVPKPNFANTGRIDSILKDGKMMLSMDDAIALALENNLDLAIARYNLSIADTDILRTASGGAARGVPTGVVQNTPGGGVGSIGSTSTGSGAGGTSVASGGAGAGTGGIVTSTSGVGSAVDNFDPDITSNLAIEHARTPLSNTVTAGVSSLASNTGTSNFSYVQGFPTGTLFSVGFNNNRQTTNSPRSSLIPTLNSSLRASFRQHLLTGWGLETNLRFIRTAKNNREISDVGFRQQVIATVSQIEGLYWDLVSAYENVKVNERALGLAQKTESDNRKQVEIGTLAPIEIVRAQAQVASSRQGLIVAQTNLQLQQLLIKNAITKNLKDPVLAAAEVIPTDTMTLPATEPVRPLQEMVDEAMAARPDLASARIDLVNRDITKKSARNALLPTVDLVGFYGTSSLAGVPNPLLAGTPGTPTSSTGFSNAFNTLFGGDFPDYSVGFNVNIPLRNRSAQADQVRSELEYRQAESRIQQLTNQIAIEVRNAQYSVQQNRAQVEAAQSARELQSQTLDAENKKYALGASTNFNVLQAQHDLEAAESNLVTALSAYEKSRVNLDQVTAQTLNHLGIEIQDAETGEVHKLPNVPGVQPNPDATSVANPPAAPSKQ